MAVSILLWETLNVNLIKKTPYNSRCRMTLLCTDENLKVSFEFIQWLRRNYGWSYIPPIRPMQRTYKIRFVKEICEIIFIRPQTILQSYYGMACPSLSSVCRHRIGDHQCNGYRTRLECGRSRVRKSIRSKQRL